MLPTKKLNLPGALAALTLLLAAPVVHGGIKEDPALSARVQGLRDEAKSATAAGDVERAIVALKRAIEIGVNQEGEMREELRALLRQRALQLAAEGDALLETQDYARAADRFVDSLGYITTPEGRQGLSRARRPARRAANKSLRKARAAYDRGDYDTALSKLDEVTATAAPVSTALQRALAHHQLGQRQLAAYSLDEHLTAMPDGKEKDDLRIVQSVMETGAGRLDPQGMELPVYKRANRLMRNLMEQRPAQISADASITRLQPDGLCELLEEIHDRVGDHPVLIYDLAQCREAQQRLGDARRAYLRYLELVPDAGDKALIHRRLQELETLEGLPETQRASVASHVISARLHAVDAHYREAIEQLEQAHRLAPRLPLPLWRLGLLHEALGEREQAEHYLNQYAALPDADPQNANAALVTLAAQEEKQARYAQLVASAHQHVSTVLARVFESQVVGTQLNEQYIQRELSRAARALFQALELYPLGEDANRYVAFVLQQTRHYERARRAMEAVFAHGGEPTYFAVLQIGLHKHRKNSVLVDGKGQAFLKLSFDGKHARLRSLAAYNRDQREWYTRWEEGQRNEAFWSERSPLPEELLTPGEVSVRTLNSAVSLQVGELEYFVYPFFLLGTVPESGRDARIFGNEYAHLFRRFGGFTDAELGKEGVTFVDALSTFTELAIGVYLGLGEYAIASLYSLGDTTPIALADRPANEAMALGRFRKAQLLTLSPRGYKLLPISVEQPRW